MTPPREWDGPPERGKERRLLKIIRPFADGNLWVTIISREITGCWVHFIDQRTQGCMGDQCLCQKVSVRKWWRGYLHIVNAADKKERLLEMPLSAVRQAGLDKSPLPSPGLLGYQLRLWRPSHRKRGPVAAEVTGILQMPKVLELPRERDVRAELEAIWSS